MSTPATPSTPPRRRGIALRTLITFALIVFLLIVIAFVVNRPVRAPADDPSITPEVTDSADATNDAGALSGQIIFMSNRDGDYDIYTLDLAIRALLNLTNNDADDGFAGYSLDGVQISHLSNRDREPGDQMGGFIMNADGSNPQPATADFATMLNIFTSGRGDWDVRSYRDGSTILVSLRDLNLEVYTRDGGTDTNVSDSGSIDWYPDLSPDGTRIAFTSDRDGGQHDIYVVTADGETLTRLTDDLADDLSPVWIRDQNALLFASERDSLMENGDIGLYRVEVNTEGATAAQVSSAPETPADAIEAGEVFRNGVSVYTSNRDGNWEIYASDGETVVNLTNDPGDDLFPLWKP